MLDFGHDQGWRVDQHPRFLADLTGNGCADIVGFYNDGVYVALSNGDGTFHAPVQAIKNHFGYGRGAGSWRVDQHPRFLADLTGDGRADIVGFYNDGVWVALNNGGGTFKAPVRVIENHFGYGRGAGSWQIANHPRFLADLTGNGRADIVGFANAGVVVALNNGDGTFQKPRRVIENNFGYGAGAGGWRVKAHPRFLADLTGDGRADIVGFASAGVSVALSNSVSASVFLRINLFVRLWRKLGWSIEEIDRALTTFIPVPFDDVASNLEKQPLKTALIYLAHLKELDEKLKLGKQARLKLLTLWSDIATTGKNSLYAQLFLNCSVLKSSPVFDHPLGKYLQYFDDVARKYKPFRWDPLQPEDTVTGNVPLRSYLLALQGALSLTAEDIGRILTDANKSLDTAELSLSNVSLLYRYGLLAKALKLSVRELIALKQLSGLDPFKALHPDPLETLDQDYPFAQTLEFVKVADEVKDSGLKIEDLEFLLQHRFDETGKYRPNRDGARALLKSLSEGVRGIHAEHAVPDDPAALSDEILRQKLGLALPADVVATFMAIMNGTAEFTVVQAVASADQLHITSFVGEPAISRLTYNEARQEQTLVFRSVLFDPQKAELKAKFNTKLERVITESGVRAG